eukprot:TRINITY_DN65910_c0_g1_i1.p2 TRINITY_DN65910_c0_g1~~TRINITY_DN65910_c0_g1_i1.p2  ORF type:complete len:101 (-),score=29.86 TRINITY_DN65910_c0_g1_i1:80-382(-)
MACVKAISLLVCAFAALSGVRAQSEEDICLMGLGGPECDAMGVEEIGGIGVNFVQHKKDLLLQHELTYEEALLEAADASSQAGQVGETAEGAGVSDALQK